MKKIISLLFVALMVISFAACEEDEESTTTELGSEVEITSFTEYEGDYGTLFVAFADYNVVKDNTYKVTVTNDSGFDIDLCASTDQSALIDQAKTGTFTSTNIVDYSATADEETEELTLTANDFISSGEDSATVYVAIIVGDGVTVTGTVKCTYVIDKVD